MSCFLSAPESQQVSVHSLCECKKGTRLEREFNLVACLLTSKLTSLCFAVMICPRSLYMFWVKLRILGGEIQKDFYQGELTRM